MMMIVRMRMMMMVSRLEDDKEEVTIREGEGLTLGCQVIAGSSIFKSLNIDLQITLYTAHS